MCTVVSIVSVLLYIDCDIQIFLLSANDSDLDGPDAYDSFLGKGVCATRSLLGNQLFGEGGKTGVQLDTDVCAKDLADAFKCS